MERENYVDDLLATKSQYSKKESQVEKAKHFRELTEEETSTRNREDFFQPEKPMAENKRRREEYRKALLERKRRQRDEGHGSNHVANNWRQQKGVNAAGSPRGGYWGRKNIPYVPPNRRTDFYPFGNGPGQIGRSAIRPNLSHGRNDSYSFARRPEHNSAYQWNRQGYQSQTDYNTDNRRRSHSVTEQGFGPTRIQVQNSVLFDPSYEDTIGRSYSYGQQQPVDHRRPMEEPYTERIITPNERRQNKYVDEQAGPSDVRGGKKRKIPSNTVAEFNLQSSETTQKKQKKPKKKKARKDLEAINKKMEGIHVK